jgi:hypothetical protein
MNMRRSIIILGAVGLTACGQSSQPENSSAAATKTAAAEQSRLAYCFFKDSETKGWAAKAGKDGNVTVFGKAYREDSRYKALLSPATVIGHTAEVSPTIGQNDTGFAAPANWWDVSETIPSSQAVTTVVVKCGDKSVATLAVQRSKYSPVGRANLLRTSGKARSLSA